MSTGNTAREQFVWQNFCTTQGWTCRICGAIPDIGKQFEDNVCEDCRLLTKNFASPDK